MTKQKSKAELSRDIQVERRQLEKTIAGLAKEDMLQPGVVEEWSVKDVLAHLVAWEQLYLSWYACGLEGKIPDFRPAEINKKSMDALNLQIYTQYRETPMEDVLSNFGKSYQQIQTVVSTVTDEELFTPGRYPWTGRWTLADFLAANTCNHYYWAKSKIRAWLKNQDRL
jgi:hypothetical protein